MRVTLSWPDSRLSPNARLHWRNRAKVAKTAKSAAYYLARAAGAEAPASGPIPLLITFYPPDNRARDMDNAIASMKSALDGLAEAMKVNDRRFVLTFAWGAAAKPGRVEIAIGGGK